MNKLKGFYHNNRVYVILMGVAFFCFALIIVALLYYFISQNNTQAYGNRLNGVETAQINDTKIGDIKKSIQENELVDSVTMRIKGRIIYVNIYVKEGKATDAKNVAIKSLDLFSETEKSIYDISFAIDRVGDSEDTIFPIMGYKKNDKTIISWTNYKE